MANLISGLGVTDKTSFKLALALISRPTWFVAYGIIFGLAFGLAVWKPVLGHWSIFVLVALFSGAGWALCGELGAEWLFKWNLPGQNGFAGLFVEWSHFEVFLGIGLFAYLSRRIADRFSARLAEE